jgi:DNA-binding CsgD family transcriptional regulator/PAS domain-containing protein
MDPSSKFSELVENVYDAALEPARWNDVVVGINDFVGSRACGLISKNAKSQFGETHYYCGVDPHYIRLYAESHSRFDPLTTLPPFGKVVGIPDLLPYDEYRRGPFFQEWLRPQGCVDVANVVLDKSDANCADLLTFLPGGRMADDEMRRRIAAIAPHARRALLVNKAIDARKSEAAAFAKILDGLAVAIFLLDSAGRIAHRNSAADNLLDAGDVLRSVNGQLVARDAWANRALREAFAASGKLPAACGCIALPMAAEDGEHYIAHLLPLTAAERGATGMAYKSVAALFVRKAALGRPRDDVIARRFELTRAELRVMLSIADVGGVPETAAALGVAESTVKTHLRRVFAKTGTNRQTELVKLIAAHVSPLSQP